MKSEEFSRIYPSFSIKGDTAVWNLNGVVGIVGFDYLSWEIRYDNRADSVIGALKALAGIEGNPVKKLAININSPGGYVDHAMTMFDFIASLGLEIETHCYGYAASAATLLAQLGKRRTISENCRYLVHRAWLNGVSGNCFELQEAARSVAADDRRIIHLYAKRSGRSAEEVERLLNRNAGNGVWLTADEVVEEGWADEVVPAERSVTHGMRLSSAALAFWSLPALPDLSGGNVMVEPARGSAHNMEEKRMDEKTLNRARQLFGADFVLDQLARNVDFAGMCEVWAEKSSARIAELESENATLKESAAASAARIAELESAAVGAGSGEAPAEPSVPPESVAVNEANAAPVRKPSVADIVKKAWNAGKKGE